MIHTAQDNRTRAEDKDVFGEDKPVERLEENALSDTIDESRYGAGLAEVEAYRMILSWDEETRTGREKALVRRLDLLICLPILITYIFNYLDRNSIAQARVSGLVTATHITQTDYALVNGIFYISYILFQTPSNMILSKTRPSLYIPLVVFGWAVVSSCTALCTSLGTLIAVRFILGIVEAPFYPGAIYYLSCWYTRKEIGKRVSVLVSGICLSNAFAGLISTGILRDLEGKSGIAGWQWIFIVEGSVTAAVAIALLFILPDYPSTTKFFSAEHRVLAQLRLEQDIGMPDTDDVSIKGGFNMAVKDWRTWAFGSLQLSITILTGFNFFYPTLIQGMGYTDTTTILLLTVPPYFLAFFVSYGMSFNADRTQKRVLHYEIVLAIACFGLILLTALASVDSPGAKYFSTFILAPGSYAAYACSYPWLASIMPRPATKRAISIGIANSMSNLGAFLASYVYYATLGPTYRTSWGITLIFGVYSMGMVYFLGWRSKARNVHLDNIEQRYRDGELNEQALQAMDYDEKLAALTGFRLAH